MTMMMLIRFGNSTLVAVSVITSEFIELEKNNYHMDFVAVLCLFFRSCAPALRAAARFVVVFSATILTLLADCTVSLDAFLF